MKKGIITLGVIAISLFAFSACEKEQVTNNEVPNEDLVTVSFTATKAGAETRTAAVDGENKVSYIWTSEDVSNIKLFTVTREIKHEEGKEDKEVEVLTEVQNPTVSKTSDTELTITGAVAPGETYKFRAILCDPTSYTGSGTDYSSRKPKSKTSQSPNGIVNYDPTADLLVSKDLVVTVGSSEEETISTGALEMSFKRYVVFNKMTLKNLQEGEKVKKVEVVSNDAKNIQGYLYNGEMSGQSNTITLHYDNVAVPANGEFPVYFASINCTEVSLTINVTTDKNTYTKSFASGKTIDFNLGQFTTFGVALPAGIPVVEIPDGDYFITGVNESQVYAAKMYVSGNNLSHPLAITVDKDNETIGYVNDIEDCIFTLTRIVDGNYAGKYTIQDVNNKYLFAAGGSGSSADNHLKAEATPDANGNAYWNISKGADGTFAIEAAGNSDRKIMRFNYNNGSPMFSCYASGQAPVTLYPASWCTIDTTPHITIDNNETSKTVLSAATSVVFNYTKNRYASDPTVSVASDPDGIVNGEPAVADGTITVSLNPNTEDKEKTATLSVSGTGLASAVTLTITQEAYQNLVNGSESFDLSKKTYTTTVNSVTWEGTSVAITNSSASGGTNATNYLGGDSNNRTSSRFYSNNTLTITPKSGYTITSVVFTATSNSYASTLSNSSWANASASVNSNNVTVTPTNGTAAITATVGGTCGFTSIVVNYLTSGSGGGSGNGEEITSGTFSGSTNNISFTTASGITITQLKGDGTDINTNYNNVGTLRVYRANQLSFTGKTFTKIEMYYSENYSGANWSVIAGGGTVSIDTDKHIVTWTNSNGASTVTLQNSTPSGTNNQLRTTSFKVTYN